MNSTVLYIPPPHWLALAEKMPASTEVAFCERCDGIISSFFSAMWGHMCPDGAKPYGKERYDQVSGYIPANEALEIAPLVLEETWVSYSYKLIDYADGRKEWSESPGQLGETFEEWFSRMSKFHFVRSGELWGDNVRPPTPDCTVNLNATWDVRKRFPRLAALLGPAS